MHAALRKSTICLALATLLCCTGQALAVTDSGAPVTGWHLVSDRNGIQVYRQDDDASRIKTFRGVTRFTLEKPAAIEAMINDYATVPRWLRFVSAVQELGRSDYAQRKLWFTTELPWPLSNRDVVADLTIQQGTDTLTISASSNPLAAPHADYLRMPEMRGLYRFRFIPATREVEVTYEMRADAGGNVPAWASNLVVKDAPYFTLLKFRRLVTDARHQQFDDAKFRYPW